MTTETNNQIVKSPTPPPVPMVNGALAPTDMDGMWRLASLFYRANMLPGGVDTAEKVCIALMAGMEVGLTPTQAIQNVMVVGNRPTIWGDAAIGLVWASGKMESHDEGIEGTGESRTAFCTVRRKGDAKDYTIRFSVTDAKTAGLWGKSGPWKTHPDRMLKLKARAFALRDKFADVLKGLGIREEIEDIEPAPTPRTVAAARVSEKLDSLTQPTPPAASPERPGESSEMSDQEKQQIVERERAEARGSFTIDGEIQ